MEANKEISALFHLIDDPDEEVFDVISKRIVDYGKPIIPHLEHLWESTPDEPTQERIELLIHRLHYTDLTEDIRQWSQAGHHDLLVGSLLVSKFMYPDLATAPVLMEIEKIRRNVWLELNNYLTPLEQVNVVKNILYHYYGLKGAEVNYAESNEFLLHKTLEAKKGNQLACGILYLLICELLDIPVQYINLPQQFVVAYFRQGQSNTFQPGPEDAANPRQSIEFFIDPSSGQVFTHHDVETYFRRLSVSPVPSYFEPRSNKEVIRTLLTEFSKCFDNDQNRYKQEELLWLASLLD